MKHGWRKAKRQETNDTLGKLNDENAKRHETNDALGKLNVATRATSKENESQKLPT